MADKENATPTDEGAEERFRMRSELDREIRRSNLQQMERERYERDRSALRPAKRRIFKGLHDD